MSNLINVKNLSYTYREGSEGAIRALENINLSVARGEYLAITGQNGSGKSTLARHFNGLLLPQSGDVFINGIPLSDRKNITAIRKIVGMVFQNPDNQLVSSIVEEDIAFGPENLGIPPAEIRDRVSWALHVLNLEEIAGEQISRLSEGQKQLVAIAGVLAMKPECIVFDEPTTHLDPRSRELVLENIARLNRDESLTVILLTHYMNEASCCDRMIIMDRGTIVIEGQPAEVFMFTDKVSSLGLELPMAARLAARLRQEGLALPEKIVSMKELVENLCRLK